MILGLFPLQSPETFPQCRAAPGGGAKHECTQYTIYAWLTLLARSHACTIPTESNKHSSSEEGVRGCCRIWRSLTHFHVSFETTHTFDCHNEMSRQWCQFLPSAIRNSNWFQKDVSLWWEEFLFIHYCIIHIICRCHDDNCIKSHQTGLKYP